MSTWKRKNGKVYYHRVKAKVREHMKTCCYYKLTLSSVPKSIFMAECFLAPDPEVGVRDEELMGLQPTQGSLQEFKLLQEVLLLEGAGVH